MPSIFPAGVLPGDIASEFVAALLALPCIPLWAYGGSLLLALPT